MEIIDFELSKRVKDLIADLKKLDEKEHWGYFNYVGTLDNVCKFMFGNGTMK